MSKQNLETMAEFWNFAGGDYNRATDICTIHFAGLISFTQAIAGQAALVSANGEALLKLHQATIQAQAQRDELLTALRNLANVASVPKNMDYVHLTAAVDILRKYGAVV